MLVKCRYSRYADEPSFHVLRINILIIIFTVCDSAS